MVFLAIMKSDCGLKKWFWKSKYTFRNVLNNALSVVLNIALTAFE